jgi:hypothetical protein
MVKSLIVGVFGCIEYTIVFLFIASLAFMLTQRLDNLVPQIYDYSTEQDLLEALREGYESKQITSQQGQEILQIYRDAQPGFRLDKWRMRLLYAVSICISAVVMVLLFKSYRLLRFRERLKAYFFPPNS